MPEPQCGDDANGQADASEHERPGLESFVADTEPLGEDESFAVTGLTEAEWDAFMRAIRE